MQLSNLSESESEFISTQLRRSNRNRNVVVSYYEEPQPLSVNSYRQHILLLNNSILKFNRILPLKRQFQDIYTVDNNVQVRFEVKLYGIEF